MLQILANANLMNEILIPVLGAVGTALAGLIGFGITRFIAWLNAKIGNEKAAKAVNALGDIIQAAVLATNQQFVDDLKKQGKFDKEAQKEAFNKTMKLVKAQITDEMRKTLTELYGDFEIYITMLIEKYIAIR